jgi:hypothetical protein
MYTNLDWHGKGTGPFESSQQAYDSMHIGDRNAAQKLQAKEAEAKAAAAGAPAATEAAGTEGAGRE